MAKKLLVLLLLPFLAERPALAGPPERPDGRMVLDRGFELRAEVRELEQEFARACPHRGSRTSAGGRRDRVA
jgi:hypothetical protein